MIVVRSTANLGCIHGVVVIDIEWWGGWLDSNVGGGRDYSRRQVAEARYLSCPASRNPSYSRSRARHLSCPARRNPRYSRNRRGGRLPVEGGAAEGGSKGGGWVDGVS